MRGEISGVLTTRFVYDWRLKTFDDGSGLQQGETKKWMRRSRYVAREFANDKRDDVYSPATGCHTANLIPILFLQRLKQLELSELGGEEYDEILASLDIKDAFLQVPQEHVVSVTLHGTEYVVLRNLPGQRLGAKAWYWFFRNFATDSMQFEWCDVQPCLAKCGRNVFMLHVDDLLFTGSRKFWNETFLPLMQQKFSVSYNVLGEVGSTVSFLKRRLVMMDDGVMLVPGTAASKVVECFEKHFGHARVQKVPTDASLQQEDHSQFLSAEDSKKFRSVIGLLLYLARDRADLMFGVKELASAMSKPTLCSVQRLRKLIGYVKCAGDVGIKLQFPEPGSGKIKHGAETEWVLETFTDADWSSNKAHRRSTSCSVHFINGCFAFGASRSQKVISLSSAESELHSMVSGCCDGIYIKSCLEFLVGLTVEHHQFTDNSAARQLISRQGVGRIRHLSGKLLWMQSKVLNGDVMVHQVSTVWNYSDVGTKNLQRARMAFLLYGIGMVDATTTQPIGLEEHEAVLEQDNQRRDISKLAKALRQITLMVSMQGLGPTLGVEAVSMDGLEMCPNESFEAVERHDSWVWMAIFTLLVVWCFFTWKLWCVWKKLTCKVEELEKRLWEVKSDMYHCWSQVADEDQYISTQEKRIDTLHNQVMMLEGKLTEAEQVASMDHDYLRGLHFGLVEIGGFVRFPMGIEAEHALAMDAQEKSNLLAHNTMGAYQYLSLIHQRTHAEAGQETDRVLREENTEEFETPGQT